MRNIFRQKIVATNFWPKLFRRNKIIFAEILFLGEKCFAEKIFVETFFAENFFGEKLIAENLFADYFFFADKKTLLQLRIQI